jgi:hypothetical protein
MFYARVAARNASLGCAPNTKNTDVAAGDLARREGTNHLGNQDTGNSDSRRSNPKPPRSLRKRALAELAERVRQLQANRRGAPERVPSDWPILNEAIGGGFVRGAIHELLAGSAAAPTWTLALRIATQALVVDQPLAKDRGASASGRCETQIAPAGRRCSPADLSKAKSHIISCETARQDPRTPDPAVTSYAAPTPAFSPDKWLIYVDAGDDFYPPAAAALGVPLDRLIVVRASRPRDVQWVCEQALRCRAVAALIAPTLRADANLSRRLQLAAEIGGGLGLLLRSDQGQGHTFAASRLRLDPLPANHPGPNETLPNQRNGSQQSSALRSRAGERRVRISVLKVRDGRPGDPFEIMMTANGRPFVAAADRAAHLHCA